MLNKISMLLSSGFYLLIGPVAPGEGGEVLVDIDCVSAIPLAVNKLTEVLVGLPASLVLLMKLLNKQRVKQYLIGLINLLQAMLC